MSNKQPTTSTQRVTSPNNGDKLPLEAPTDQWGDTHEVDRDTFPEGTNARAGETTAPSGQGGATPHDGISYQDKFPPNPEPDDVTKAWGKYLEDKERAVARGEDPPEPPFQVRTPTNADVKPAKSSSASKEVNP